MHISFLALCPYHTSDSIELENVRASAITLLQEEFDPKKKNKTIRHMVYGKGAYGSRYNFRTFVLLQNCSEGSRTVLSAAIFDIQSEGNVEILYATTNLWARGLGLMRILTGACANLAASLGGTKLYVAASQNTINFWGNPSLFDPQKKKVSTTLSSSTSPSFKTTSDGAIITKAIGRRFLQCKYMSIIISQNVPYLKNCMQHFSYKTFVKKTFTTRNRDVAKSINVLLQKVKEKEEKVEKMNESMKNFERDTINLKST